MVAARLGAGHRVDWGLLAITGVERITHTRLGSWRILLRGGRPVIVVARRRPVTDELLWFVFPAADGPKLRAVGQWAQVERIVARLAAESKLSAMPLRHACPGASRGRENPARVSWLAPTSGCSASGLTYRAAVASPPAWPAAVRLSRARLIGPPRSGGTAGGAG